MMVFLVRLLGRCCLLNLVLFYLEMKMWVALKTLCTCFHVYIATLKNQEKSHSVPDTCLSNTEELLILNIPFDSQNKFYD